MKRYLAVGLLVVVVLSFGCRRAETPEMDYPVAIEYHKGTEALEISAVKSLPPREIIEGNDFIIGLELRNKGAYDIEGGSIMVYGFEQGYIAVEDPVRFFDIEGKKPGFPEGGYEIINFNARNLGMPEITERYAAAYTISTYYRYRTEAGAEVCINPNLYNYVKTKEIICEPSTISLSGGQGAPVAVTKIEQGFSPLGNKIKADFIIHIANKGEGDVVGGVFVEEVKLSNAPIGCILIEEPIKLEKKEEKTFLCSTETPLSAGAYLAPLSIELEYDYSQRLEGKVDIKSTKIRRS